MPHEISTAADSGADVNLVPREEVSFEQVAELAERAGWECDGESGDAEIPIRSWRAALGRVSLTKNSALRCDYFVVDSPDAGAVTAAIRDRFPCHDLAGIVEDLNRAESPNEKVDALHLLAAAEPRTFDEGIHRAVLRYGADDERRVRLAAVVAADHLNWRRLREFVQRVALDDESEVLRNVSANVLNMATWDQG